VGIDIGGTKIAGALVDESGLVIQRSRTATPPSGPSVILATVRDLVDTVAEGHDPVAVGIGTGGVVDPVQGRIVSATNLLTNWAGTEVSAELSDDLGMPVYVDNDANALATGELCFGQLSGTGLFAAVGTGIGGALIVDGAVRHGQHNTAGGIGHMMSPIPTSRLCSCGRPSHVESLASGPAIASDYQRQKNDDQDVTLETVAERAADGEQLARETIETATHALGQAIGAAANLVDPDIIIVGGGVANIGELFWKPLRHGIRAEVLPPIKEIDIEPPQLKRDAAVIGAAALAFLHFK
jgi:glucokinase